VDDSSRVRSALCEIFRHADNFEVCGEAGDGREAIEKAQQLNPDLVLTDLSMPIMNGIEECRALKKIMPEVPVIIVTAYLDPSVEKEALSAGASAVISKSEQIAALLGKAKSVVDTTMSDSMAA
jgi:DNA-binding NarL/FixJ family response regulator